MSWIWLLFWIVAAVFAFIVAGMIFMGILNWCLSMALGGAPPLHWWNYLRHLSKCLRGLRPEYWTWACPNGYLCHSVRYSDGSNLYFWEDSRIFQNLPYQESR